MTRLRSSLALLLATSTLSLTACSSDGGAPQGDPVTSGGVSGLGGSPSAGGAPSGGTPGNGGGLTAVGGAGSGGVPATGGAPGSGGQVAPSGGTAPGTGGDAQATGGQGTGGDSGGEPEPAAAEDTGLDCQVDAPTGPNGGDGTKLPDPYTRWDGSHVATMADWRCRRRELVTEVEKRILGAKAPPPALIGGTVGGTISNSAYAVEVTTPGGSTNFSGTVKLPGTGSAPFPAVVVVGGFNSLNADVLESEGVATLSYDNNAIASEASGNFTNGKYFEANPDFKGKTGALVAWAWGVSRIIDMLEQNPGVIDPTKIAVHGCSRLGKAAFVIGAFDQRIALGLPLEPGTGGPAPLRALPSLGGQTLASANSEAAWFGPTSGSYSATMAVDMSDVATMYAPRGLLMMDNPHITHLAYKANYLGTAAARKVYESMGAEDAAWYLGNSGNGSHCAVRAEYGAPLRAMIKKFLKGDASATTGGLDTHANHSGVDVNAWTSAWTPGTIAP